MDSVPQLNQPAAITAQIRKHYDQLSPLYGSLWGEHIHHGYWEGDESASEAQQKLTAKLAERAGVARGSTVLDIGCGLGGSARWLAKRLDCRVHGITLSPSQAEAAVRLNQKAGVADRVRIEVRDANHLDPAPDAYDAVWIIEASEHLLDKAKLFRDCHATLHPAGGVLALCAWLRAEELDAAGRQLVRTVEEGMLCPALGSAGEYRSWLQAAGFEQVRSLDVTRQVEKTWRLCGAIAARAEVKALLALADGAVRRFVGSFAAIERAYATGAMAYGMFTARRAR